MIAFLLWYFTISLIGLIVFPLAYRLLPALPDRGYSLSKALGLLLWGYIFWLLTTLGVLRNTPGGLLFAVAILIALGVWTTRSYSREEMETWWRTRRSLVLAVEILFLAAFSAWTIVRAANPEIQFTEKPMELAFINAIMDSSVFPPHDPWLSGYSISYYYFGYVMVAMLAQLTSIPGGVAFNLGIALVFALSVVGAYGLIYNLIEVWKEKGEDVVSVGRRIESGLYALLGPFFVLIVSNLEGFLDVLHARGIFWNPDASGQLTSSFWKWLDMQDLSHPPTEPFSWMPTRSWWWWRASRVVQDYDLAGNYREVIDEFPFFSYLLADLHPHVLAMPFSFLAIGITLNLFLGGGKGKFRWLGLPLHINPQFFTLAALGLGGMAFLNTWDFPIYLSLFCGAYILLRAYQEGWRTKLLGDFLMLGLALGISGAVLYLPFYLGFSSQAGGVLPNLIYVTRGTHLWVMFGQFLVPLAVFLFYIWNQGKEWRRWKNALLLAAGITVILFVLSLLMGLAIVSLPVLGDLFLGSLAAGGHTAELFRQAFLRRLINPGAWITLVVILATALGLLLPKHRGIGDSEEGKGDREGSISSNRFFILLVLVGTLLVLGPEFFFLRDQFGWRINTIFKFYFQAWMLWGIASAYGTAVLLHALQKRAGFIFRGILVLVLGAALVYPVLGLWTKTEGFSPAQGFTLDGSAYFARQNPDEMAAIHWLRTAPSGVVLEAVGGSYTEYARVATLSGQPTVLGWPGHESQWRGGAKEIGSREEDVAQIFRLNDWNVVQDLLHRYDVRYVFVGSLERSKYGVSETKFERFLTPVFRLGQVVVFEVPIAQ